MEQSNIFIIEYSMEYMCTLWLAYNYKDHNPYYHNFGGHGILGLKGLNPSIFHHWCNHTNVDLVHHMAIQGHYDGTTTNSKYQIGLQVEVVFFCHLILIHSSSSKKNPSVFIFLNYYIHIFKIAVLSFSEG